MNLRVRPFAVCIAISVSSSVWAQTTTLESASSQGIGGDARSQDPLLSSDGRYVVFRSLAGNLVFGDTNAVDDIFVRDRQTGVVERVSVATGGAQGDKHARSPYAISPDGRWVTFGSAATTLVAGDTNSSSDVFLHDRVLGTTERVSLANGGGQADGPTFDADATPDVRFIVFDNLGGNLVAGDTNFKFDIFVHDRTTGVVTRESVGPLGQQLGDDSTRPAISDDGRFVAFTTGAPNLIGGDLHPFLDVFVRDRVLGTLEGISVTATGAAGNSDSYGASFSADGRYVAFTSHASNLTPDTGIPDVFVRDRLTQTTEKISVDSTGSVGNGPSLALRISPDGRFVLFFSEATDLVPGDTNGRDDLFVRDRVNGTTTMASVGFDGSQGIWDVSNTADLSADGRFVAFSNNAAGLVLGDANGVLDVFLRDLASTCTPMQSYCSAKPSSAGCWPTIVPNGSATVTGNDAFFVTAQFALPGKPGLFLWGRTAASIPFGGGTLCVAPPVVRTTVQTSAGGLAACDGTFSFYFSHAYMTQQALVAGDSIYGQYWFRDNGFAPPNNIGLTNALEFTLCF